MDCKKDSNSKKDTQKRFGFDSIVFISNEYTFPINLIYQVCDDMYLLAQKWHTTFQFQKTQISNRYLSKYETSKIYSKSTFKTKFLNCGKKSTSTFDNDK